MVQKKIIYYSALLFLTSFNCFANIEQDFSKANVFYTNQKYEEAIPIYESIISNNYFSDDVFYNLGNAYFKSNQLGLAILNYEKAVKLNPVHEDALFNLSIANAKTIDKVERLPSMFIGNAWQTLITSKTVANWSYFCVFLLFISLFLFVSYLLVRIVIVKKVGFYGGCFFLLLSLFSWFMAFQHTTLQKNKTQAIVLSPVVDVLSEPNQSSQKLFTLHEGIKVSLLENNNNWSKIKIPNGNIGWLKNEVVKEI